MAARENQGLQIALIIFVVLTIMLIVSTYFFFSGLQQEREKSKVLTADNAKLTKQAGDDRDERDAIKTMIGADSKDGKDAVLTKLKKDCDAYGKGIVEANQNYRYLVEQMAGELKNANTRITEVTASEAKLTEKIKTDEEAKEQEMEKYTSTVTQTGTDLADQRKGFEKARGEINKSKDDLKGRFESKRAEFDNLTRKSGAEIARGNEELGKLTKRLQDIAEREQRGLKASELADGRIVKVDQRNRTAWINRGSADGLRRQTGFLVIDAEDSNPLEGRRKGKLEIVRVINDHMAEARIVEDDLSNPMMLGDPVFSIAWEPGRTEHFALAGRMDIDKDEKSDLDRVRNLIALSGGVIDEEIGDDDQKTGQMTIHTKYLVVGDPPTVDTKSKNYSEAQSEAQLLGVRTIKLDEFLNYLGYKSEDRTVGLGTHARSKDFRPRLPGDRQRVRPTSPTDKVRTNPASKD